MNSLERLTSPLTRPEGRHCNRFRAALIAVLMATSLCHAQTGALSAEARRDIELRPGVALIYIQLAGSISNVGCQVAVSGTGFLYRPDGYLITNGHVAQMANTKDEDALRAQKVGLFKECLQKTIEKKISRSLTPLEQAQVLNGMKVESSLTVMLDNGTRYGGEIKAYSDPITSGGKDVAIIKIDGSNLPTVPLGSSDDLNVNDHVYVIGYPKAANISKVSMLVASTSDGIISAVKNKDYSGTPLIQTNANINHGNSGGPGFDASGKVIGIATFGSGEGPGYNFLVPIDTAKEFVRQAGGEPQRGAFDKTWHDALEAYSNAQWSRAHALLNDVLEMMPNQPEAQKLQLQAAANERLEGPVQRLQEAVSMPVLIGGGALILLVGGLLIWLLARKPKAASPAPHGIVGNGPSPAVASGGATRLIEASPRSTTPPAEQFFGALHVSGGPLLGNRFPIPKAGLLLGRDPSRCSVVLPDDSVSKEHAWVVPLDNGVAVIDRDSANGTYVNSIDSPRINRVVLRHGDRVYLGKKSGTVLTYYSA